MVGLDNVSKLLILLNIPPYCTLLKNKQNPQQQKVLVLVEKSIHTADTLYYLKSLLSLRRSCQELAYYLLLLQKTPYCSFRLNVENINSQCWGIKRNKLFQNLFLFKNLNKLCVLHCSNIYIATVKIPHYFIIINSQIIQIPQLWLLLPNSTTVVRSIIQPRKHFYLQNMLAAKELDKRLVFQQSTC